jgi:hypothetical protein
MVDPGPIAFPHKPNDDGTFDSICPLCFRTVARKAIESQLAELERKHICEKAGDWLELDF